jgi:hypothetical protein
LNDDEGVATRWSEVDHASVVLLRAQEGNAWSFLDGTVAKVTAKWEFEAARAIHRNLVRVPSWMLGRTSTALLSRYVEGAAAAAIIKESGVIELTEGVSGPRLLYDSRLGIHSPL